MTKTQDAQIEKLQQEIATLKTALLALSKGASIDAVSLAPLPLCHLNVIGIGKLSPQTALDLLPSASPKDLTHIARATYETIRQFQLPAFGHHPGTLEHKITQEIPLFQSFLRGCLALWTQLGADLTKPYSFWDPKSPAAIVLKTQRHQ